MNRQPRLIEGPYLQDLLDQPEAIWDTTHLLAASDLGNLPDRLRHADFDRIVLTGMGSSFHALHLATPALAATGVPVLAVETSELIHALPGTLSSRTLLLVVSQSGRSAETLRLLHIIPPGCSLVGITNSPKSPLANLASPTLLTRAGHESSVACKTYSASVAALIWFCEVLRGADPGATADHLSQSADAVAKFWLNWRDHLSILASLLNHVQLLYFVGRGRSLAAVGNGALTVKEAARFPAEGASSAGFRHGPTEVADARAHVMILEGSASIAPLNRRLLNDLHTMGVTAHAIDRHTAYPPFRLPAVPDSLLPLLEILPFQMISLALAAMAGQEAGRFRRATKITETE